MKNMFTKPVRCLTISSKLVRAQFKRSIKPQLTLSGDWMAKAGFSIGEKVSIEIEADRLVIKRLADVMEG
ncbi:SymE family type I addiction module toxin [Flavobacterium psychrotrophum]|uniref:SymE family type I addiction module toxin n=1 Tax=Flavobacterium psychrotrophum TaxID=2294119 RepID=UPI000E31CB22|nr:SymE family type I addiction module toxin [Flavobacterium psychrotrophum]